MSLVWIDDDGWLFRMWLGNLFHFVLITKLPCIKHWIQKLNGHHRFNTLSPKRGCNYIFPWKFFDLVLLWGRPKFFYYWLFFKLKPSKSPSEVKFSVYHLKFWENLCQKLLIWMIFSQKSKNHLFIITFFEKWYFLAKKPILERSRTFRVTISRSKCPQTNHKMQIVWELLWQAYTVVVITLHTLT